MTYSREALVLALNTLLNDWVNIELELRNKETINKEYLEHIRMNISHMQNLLDVIEGEIK